MEIYTVIIADDHTIFRNGLKTVLNEIPYVKVIGEASNGLELLRLMKIQAADIVFMDINMPEMNGVEATKKVKDDYINTSVIVLTMHEEIGYFNQMVEVGADAFLLKKTTKDELDTAIKSVISGENYFSKEFVCNIKAPVIKKKQTNVDLSKREIEILELICKGYSNIEMAKMLNLSQKTVDGHRTRLLEKTGAKNSANLVMFAIQNNIVNINT